jgi:hypothetical protein
MPESTSRTSTGSMSSSGTFNADLYVWLRYGGDNAAPTHIEFPDLRTDTSLGGFDLCPAGDVRWAVD